ncbi:MAG: S-layer homology domain-containing protein [Clostridiales bacterium]|nr:S-layer homology domain-containing protein [Clostridiales bacterium]
MILFDPMNKYNPIVFTVLLLVILLIGLALPVPVMALDNEELDFAISKAAKYMLNTVKDPQVDSVGGEWAVLGLARSGYVVPDSFYENYYQNVEKYVKDNDGILHQIKYTEYSRVVLGLTAAGYDPRDVAGYDLTAPLQDFDKTVWQGINGPIFALLALDSMDYSNARRDDYIMEILQQQLKEGSWSLAGNASDNQTGDPDITGMAVQALAKYQHKPEIKAATDKALQYLSKTQDAMGGYASWGSDNNESAAQVVVALCELGIPIDDIRFVKNGNTLIDYIMSFQNTDGSFNHMREKSDSSQMSSEQALYALVAAQRMRDGKNSLYCMKDTVKRSGFATLPDKIGLTGKHPEVLVMPIINPGKTFADIKNHPNQAAIEILAERGIVSGKNEISFDPNASMTRAEFTAIITRGLGLPEKINSPFSDVLAENWYANPIATAYFYEIVNGVSSTVFKPNGTITRQEAAVMITRAAELCGMETTRGDAIIRDTLAQFADYRTVASWAQGSLAFCYDTGMLDDDILDINPTQIIKRCEIAEMLYRLLEKANLLALYIAA